MRNDRQFQQVLDAATKAAALHHEQTSRVTGAFLERYGITHSDVDADSLIEVLDYGNGGRITVREADEEMAIRGHPKLTS